MTSSPISERPTLAQLHRNFGEVLQTKKVTLTNSLKERANIAISALESTPQANYTALENNIFKIRSKHIIVGLIACSLTLLFERYILPSNPKYTGFYCFESPLRQFEAGIVPGLMIGYGKYIGVNSMYQAALKTDFKHVVDQALKPAYAVSDIVDLDQLRENALKTFKLIKNSNYTSEEKMALYDDNLSEMRSKVIMALKRATLWTPKQHFA